MYEFTDKKTRQKFKRTAYGKKTNEMLIKSLIADACVLVIGLLMFLFYKIDLIDFDLFAPIMGLLLCLFLMSIATSCYFDGKRDGAIEQYKRTK